jgi:type II secretory pathway pseudopilin PulG
MKKGISLIVLVVTIIVIIILAGTIMLSLGKNNPITQSKEAAFKNNIATYKSDLEITILSQYAFMLGNNGTEFTATDNAKVKQAINSISDNDINNIRILNSRLIYIGNNVQEQNWAKELGLVVGQDASYLMELNTVAVAVDTFIKNKAINNSIPYIGTELSTNFVEIRGIVYATGWYELSASDLALLNLNNVQFAPYIVSYENGTAINVAGRIIDGTPVHYIAYNGPLNALTKNGLLSGVDENSIKNTQRWGQLSLEQSIYTDILNQYSVDGGLLLSKTSNIGVLQVDQTRPINEKYSVNITVNGTTNQTGSETEFYPATICAISDVSVSYILWLGICNNKLTLYSYSGLYGEILDYSVETVMPGYASIDISEFNNKTFNIQVTGRRAEKTRIYINGILKLEFNSGDKNYTYNALTIGDLRKGRGLKYVGAIYNFALYSEILTPAEITQNWNYTKESLGL